MANTEGLSDEALSSLLAMPHPEEDRRTRPPSRPRRDAPPAAPRPPGLSRRSLARRERMMELGEGEAPAARVLRSSRAPRVVPASPGTKKGDGGTTRLAGRPPDQAVPTAHGCGSGGLLDDGVDAQNKSNHRLNMLSTCVRERLVVDANIDKSATASAPKKVSRFKHSRNINRSPTVGGFPSLDIAPVGTFTRGGRSSARVRDPLEVSDRMGARSGPQNSRIVPHIANAGNNVGSASESMLANMSPQEISDGVEEITSILSADSIAFLRKRGRQKAAKSKEAAGRAMKHDNNVPKNSNISPEQRPSSKANAVLTKNEQVQLEESRAREEKERTAELLSSVRSPEDMDRVYEEGVQLGLAAELPSSALNATDGKEFGECRDERLKNLHTFASLLRSTAPRQRLLGAKRLCEILEEDVDELDKSRRACSFSDSHDERRVLRKKFPQLLPVALRCLLDEAIVTFRTPGGRFLLSLVLRCTHALTALFVHPYHAVNISPAVDCDDPFILYQTCFMSDVSHTPPGDHLYAPTQITSIGDGVDKNTPCYRANSSAATAELDSRAFYDDPAWTMLSQMRMLPCLSDALRCLSADRSAGLAIPDTTIRSICGILAMMATRSPGAAVATARHKGILPFLVSYCFSPAVGADADGSEEYKIKDDNNSGLFRTGAALPALILLCHLARQSRDIAALEMPFQTIVPDLQSILCAVAISDKELEVQTWALVLLRILMRYGFAAEHVQSLINIAAPRLELMQPENVLGPHFLLLFASVCDASRVVRRDRDTTNSLPTTPEADACLAMSGVWLSSTIRSCVNSFQVNRCSKNHMKLASAQLKLLASYVSAAAPAMEASSIPIVKSCIQVMEAALESAMLDKALEVALAASFNSYWGVLNCPQRSCLADEAISCSFVSSLMGLVQVVGQEDLNSGLRTKLADKIMDSLGYVSAALNRSNIHPARQSWFVESEFAVFKVLLGESSGQNWLAPFAFSLIGRLNIGHEVLSGSWKPRHLIDNGNILDEIAQISAAVAFDGRDNLLQYFDGSTRGQIILVRDGDVPNLFS